jgi:hypothetical protein
MSADSQRWRRHFTVKPFRCPLTSQAVLPAAPVIETTAPHVLVNVLFAYAVFTAGQAFGLFPLEYRLVAMPVIGPHIAPQLRGSESHAVTLTFPVRYNHPTSPEKGWIHAP